MTFASIAFAFFIAAAPAHFRFLEGATETEVRTLGGSAVELQQGSRRWSAEVHREVIVQTANLGEPRLDGVELVRPLMPSAGLYLVRSSEDALTLAARLAPMVEQGVLLSAAPDLWLPHVAASIQLPPNDPRYGGQWYLKSVHAEEAWHLSTGSPDTVVAVIDDGCDLNHPDLRDHLLPGRDVISKDDDPSYLPHESGNEHGTSCAGIVSASTDNGVGIAGACPDCRVRCVRLLPGASELVPVSADIDAFQFVLSSGSAVASNSWGFKNAMPVPGALATAIKALETQGRGGLGTVVVFAAGNDAAEIHSNELQAIENVLNVGAVNNFDEAAPFSNSGESLAVVAPTGTLTLDISGSDGLDPSDYTSNFGGTSSACPVVAGIVGLILSANPHLTAAEVRQLIKDTARPAPFATPDENGHDKLYGFGIVDAQAVVARAIGEGPDGGTTETSPKGGCRCDATGASLSFLSLFLVGTRRRNQTKASIAGGTRLSPPR